MKKTGSILFGNLLYGGVSQYRLLGSSTSNCPQRRVGEKTVIKNSADDQIPTWVQFGGSARKYKSVDMGSSAVLELTLSGRKEEATDADANDDTPVRGMLLIRGLFTDAEAELAACNGDATKLKKRLGDMEDKDEKMKGIDDLTEVLALDVEQRWKEKLEL